MMLEMWSKSVQKPAIFRYSVVIVQHNSTSDYSAATMHRLLASGYPTIEHCALILTHCWTFPKETINLCSPNLAIHGTQEVCGCWYIKEKVLRDVTTCTLINRQPLFRISLLPPAAGQKTLKPETASSYEIAEKKLTQYTDFYRCFIHTCLL
jgi:hypothetical protein